MTNLSRIDPGHHNGMLPGNRWRKQGKVHKCFVKSTEVVSATTSPSKTIEITCNQVKFLRNYDGTKCEYELLHDAFLLGVDVVDM